MTGHSPDAQDHKVPWRLGSTFTSRMPSKCWGRSPGCFRLQAKHGCEARAPCSPRQRCLDL